MRGMGWCGVLDDGTVDRVSEPRYLKKAEGNPAGRRCEAAFRCSQPATCRGRQVTVPVTDALVGGWAHEGKAKPNLFLTVIKYVG